MNFTRAFKANPEAILIKTSVREFLSSQMVKVKLPPGGSDEYLGQGRGDETEFIFREGVGGVAHCGSPFGSGDDKHMNALLKI